MKINKEIEKKLENFSIKIDDAVPYLLSLYYNYSPSYIPEKLKIRLHAAGIIQTTEDKIVQFVTPLFTRDGQEVKFQWVIDEYIPLFKKHTNRSGNKASCLARMKNFFAENPEVRKEDVLEATKLYISQTDPMFTRMSHYFISKDTGKNSISDLEMWLEQIREGRDKTQKLEDVI